MIQARFSVFIAIFMLSGLSGLIYESIWSHYLKLLLGHASYAQVLVLSIFMGGMAIGSFIASRLGERLRNLILCYGAVEFCIGVSALLFHPIFIEVQAFTFDILIPATGSELGAQLAKWSVGSIMILPQSILLGATFPFLAAGIVRKFPKQPGGALGALYFANSFGAAIGILINSFFILPTVGLPGSIMTAGIINILIAIAVYGLSKGDNYPAEPRPERENGQFGKYLFVIAALTGLASFLYEIAWIRMLTMVLGGSSHSFEIMLAAFILGLAIGGLLIRKWIDKLKQPVLTLAGIQVSMGILAALTIPLYGYMFDMMGFAFSALGKTDEGHVLFLSISLLFSLFIMLPATICAGTTLPLVSCILLGQKAGDSAIGKVYAWNTVGAIAGIILASQVIMPLMGLESVVLAGAVVDIALGCYLFWVVKSGNFNARYLYGALGVIATLLLFISSLSFDLDKMSSGVFRNGVVSTKGDVEVMFHEDGKTSTVAVKRFGESYTIVNNGKPDAAININSFDGPYSISGDEPTMVLLGTLPYLYEPKAKLVANIGMGSGMTAHTMLLHPGVEQVDTIEIEKEVYNGAKIFGAKVERMFSDPRSNPVFEDAKTYFAGSQKTYDAIVSEPPNPWVSGVAGLFTTEFYRDIKRYLKPDGVFVQWMHIYELNDDLLATVYRAVSDNFIDIHIYRVGEGDIAFVAADVTLKADYEAVLRDADFSKQLKMVGIEKPADFRFRKLADKAALDALFESYDAPANSDYFPVLDFGASKARFKSQSATGVLAMSTARLLHEVTGGERYENDDLSRAPQIPDIQYSIEVRDFFSRLRTGLDGVSDDFYLSNGKEHYSSWMAAYLSSCSNDLGDRKEKIGVYLIDLTGWAFRMSSKKDALWLFTEIESCGLDRLTPAAADWVKIHKSWLLGDYEAVFEVSHYALKAVGLDIPLSKKLLAFNMAAQIKLGVKKEVAYTLDQSLFDHFKSDIELRGLMKLYSEL